MSAREASHTALSRRLALSLLAALALGCGGTVRPQAPPAHAAAAPPLKLDPAVDLVVSAGLLWLVDARPSLLLADPAMGPALESLVPDARLQRFADRHGGVDLRKTDSLVVAGYARSTLALARDRFDPKRVEEAFVARASAIDGRTTERGVTRIVGSVGKQREEVALFGDGLVALEWGEAGPLRAAEYLAQGRLRRSHPALQTEPLSEAATLLGEAPLRVFAAGPFEGAWAKAAAGLLGATTAVGIAVRSAAGARAGGVAVELVLLGGWGADAGVAAERLRSVFGVLAADPLGQLTGLDRPIAGPTVVGDADALRLDVVLDAALATRGVRAATQANIDEMMSY